MIPYLFESRSKPYDDECGYSVIENQPDGCTLKWSDILLVILSPLLILIISVYPLLCGVGYLIYKTLSPVYHFFRKRHFYALIFVLIVLGVIFYNQAHPFFQTSPFLLVQKPGKKDQKIVEIVVDDFKPQPYQGEPVYYYNRLEGDRGAINNSILEWGDGNVRMVIAPGTNWGGVWMSLNHPMREGLSINFSAILPDQIIPAYQSQITGLVIDIQEGTPRSHLRFELKDGDRVRWHKEIRLSGQKQSITYDLPALGDINQLVWVLDPASPKDYVILNKISFQAATPIKDTATAAFVWSYGMLLNNWNPGTGLVRDKAKDASGEFDAIQATGSLAAATALAEEMEVVQHNDAVRIVQKINEAFLKLPRYHGLWPHWVSVSPVGEMAVVENTEWSSVDTVIAALGLLEAQQSLDLDTAKTEQVLREIDWQGLTTDKGISHGYSYSGHLIPYAWDTFGGESWLIEFAYAGANGKTAPLAYPSTPSANGSGFIDEIAWLYLPPPDRIDFWGTDWNTYRQEAAENQVSYDPNHYPGSCNSLLGLFGLSAGEVPDPSSVPQSAMYQAFGTGGRFAKRAVDGTDLYGSSVVIPHYSAMIASLQGQKALAIWTWLMEAGLFSPLTNVESLMLPDDSGCIPDTVIWNQLKGSWNLSLQTLGWGNYLVLKNGKRSNLWEAVETNPFLQKAYQILVPPQRFIPPVNENATWQYLRECENPDTSTVGQTISRSEASGLLVHGQFGADGGGQWLAKTGFVEYRNILVPDQDEILLKVRYSKHSPASVPILVYLDNDPTPRASIQLADQGNWDQFTWTETISLGLVAPGSHTIIFYTDGQQYGTADLDEFLLWIEADIDKLTSQPVTTSSPVASGASPGRITSQDLLVWYDFEDDLLTSGRVTDRSGNGYDAQTTGQVKVTQGISGGKAIQLSGNGYLQCSQNPAAGLKEITFALWFKTEHPEENYKLASAAWWRSGPASGWILATHMPEFWSDDTKSLFPEGTTSNENDFVPGKWTYEVLTYDGNRIKEYTDGRLVNDWPTTGMAIGSGQAMVVGGWPPHTGFQLIGAIDEFQIYKRCLSTGEIQDIYKQAIHP